MMSTKTCLPALFATLFLAACAVPAGPVGSAPAATPAAVTRPAPDWRDGPFMEIYVRAYQDSDGDGIGDLKGLIARLDYLKDLGIRGIWLMPVTQSADRDHGYAVQDYRAIEKDYGTLADFDALLAAAHARGIGIIIDYVVNHSASTHPFFLAALGSPRSPYREWYLFRDPAPTGWNIYGANPWRPAPGSAAPAAYFAAFHPTMPDFNLRHAPVMAYHQESMRFWLDRGVDGFRFDAVGHLVENGPDAWDNQPENIPLAGRLRETVERYDGRYIVCEAPGQPRAFAARAACGSAFAFDLHEHVVKAARGEAAAIAKVAAYFQSAPPAMATMLSNHDLFAGERLWDQVGGNLAQYKLAAATYLLQPGVPFIYYGEEIGMSAAHGLSGDPRIRTPMSWTPATGTAGFTTGTPFRAVASNAATQNVDLQQRDAGSLLSHYKRLLALRNARPSLSRGAYVNAAAAGQVMHFARQWGTERSLVVINFGSAATAVPAAADPTGRRRLVWSTHDLEGGMLPPQSAAVFDLPTPG